MPQSRIANHCTGNKSHRPITVTKHQEDIQYNATSIKMISKLKRTQSTAQQNMEHTMNPKNGRNNKQSHRLRTDSIADNREVRYIYARSRYVPCLTSNNESNNYGTEMHVICTKSSPKNMLLKRKTCKLAWRLPNY